MKQLSNLPGPAENCRWQLLCGVVFCQVMILELEGHALTGSGQYAIM